jgi:hypothetical protein
MSMDDLFSKHQVDQLDFSKVDIEGSEFDLFRTGAEWLIKVSRIAMEVHPEFSSASELQSTLESSGMSTELRDNDLYPVSALPAVGGYLFGSRSLKRSRRHPSEQHACRRAAGGDGQHSGDKGSS